MATVIDTGGGELLGLCFCNDPLHSPSRRHLSKTPVPVHQQRSGAFLDNFGFGGGINGSCANLFHIFNNPDDSVRIMARQIRLDQGVRYRFRDSTRRTSGLKDLRCNRTQVNSIKEAHAHSSSGDTGHGDQHLALLHGILLGCSHILLLNLSVRLRIDLFYAVQQPLPHVKIGIVDQFLGQPRGRKQ